MAFGLRTNSTEFMQFCLLFFISLFTAPHCCCLQTELGKWECMQPANNNSNHRRLQHARKQLSKSHKYTYIYALAHKSTHNKRFKGKIDQMSVWIWLTGWCYTSSALQLAVNSWNRWERIQKTQKILENTFCLPNLHILKIIKFFCIQK